MNISKIVLVMDAHGSHKVYSRIELELQNTNGLQGFEESIKLDLPIIINFLKEYNPKHLYFYILNIKCSMDEKVNIEDLQELLKEKIIQITNKYKDLV